MNEPGASIVAQKTGFPVDFSSFFECVSFFRSCLVPLETVEPNGFVEFFSRPIKLAFMSSGPTTPKTIRKNGNEELLSGFRERFPGRLSAI